MMTKIEYDDILLLDEDDNEECEDGSLLLKLL